MSARRWATLATGVSLAAGWAPAAAATETPLPSPTAALSPSPPLLGGPLPRVEGRRHRVTATERVAVSLDHAGRPFAISVEQRLDVRLLGDYVFVIPVPATRVTAAAGSQSTPGFRTDQLLWNGFNGTRKLLGARIDLAARRGASSLPLRVRIVRDGGTTRVLLENVTDVRVPTFTSDAEAAGVLRYLDALRGASRAGALPPVGAARTFGPIRPIVRSVLAPLHVRGTIRVGAQTRRVDVVLGDGHPARIAVEMRSGKPPRLHLLVEPTDPVRLLTPSAAKRWVDVRGLNGRALVDRATAALLTLARVHQYRQYVGNPDPVGTSSTTYVFASTERRHAIVPPSPAQATNGSSPLRTLAVVGGLLLGLAGATVVWARS